MSDQVVENTMIKLGMLSNQTTMLPLTRPPLMLQSKLPSCQMNPTKTQQTVPLVNTSQNLVGPSYFGQNLVDPSQILVNPSHSSSQLGSTKITQAPTKNTPAIQQAQALSELGQQAKGDLDILVATGKTKDFLGKQLTFNELDNLSEKDLLKFHRLYQSTLASTINDVFSKNAIKIYSKLVSWMLPIDDEEKLYEELRNDYILMTELDRWTGWLALKMGGLAAVVTTSMLTVSHIDFVPSTNLPNINERSGQVRDTVIGERGTISGTSES